MPVAPVVATRSASMARMAESEEKEDWASLNPGVVAASNRRSARPENRKSSCHFKARWGHGPPETSSGTGWTLLGTSVNRNKAEESRSPRDTLELFVTPW